MIFEVSEIGSSVIQQLQRLIVKKTTDMDKSLRLTILYFQQL